MYGNLTLFAVGANPDCQNAANAINENSERPELQQFYLQALGQSQVSQPADSEKSYLLVFETSNFKPYQFTSVCTTGSIVASLNQTDGGISSPFKD
ncbi:unnamed protein product [Polarella glacialis]|uniref:Uncharacterized protein n=1 Tax=Polarella glacialis TaxID=89957 RepID=A0A813DBU7_POLGL|nr:unnamed protein product [Polarella glacialis]